MMRAGSELFGWRVIVLGWFRFCDLVRFGGPDVLPLLVLMAFDGGECFG